MMSVQCPHCASRNTAPLSGVSPSTTTATCIGAIGGATSAVLAAMRAAGPITGPIPFALTTIAQLVLLGLGGAVTGAQIGNKLGGEFNTALSQTVFTCCNCNKTFSKPLMLVK